MKDDGTMRAAVLLLALGEDEAAEVMKYLAPREVQRIGATMANLVSVDHSQIEEALEKLNESTSHQSFIGNDSDEFIKSVLNKALGEDVASNLLERIMSGREAGGLDSLRWMEPSTIADLVRSEHPQIIATILVHMEPSQASDVLGFFTPRLRQETMLRIATLDSVKPLALKELNEVLTKLLLSSKDSVKSKSLGGTRAAAEIMNYMSGENETGIIESLKGYDEVMAQKIIDSMFIFEDIATLEDSGIQLILRDIPSEQLVIALKGATEQMRTKIYKNMSTRAGEMLKEDLESRGPVKLSEVEATQKQILQVVRKMSDDGLIELGHKEDDEQYI
jgi:flagellar motor switch protein FliG